LLNLDSKFKSKLEDLKQILKVSVDLDALIDDHRAGRYSKDLTELKNRMNIRELYELLKIQNAATLDELKNERYKQLESNRLLQEMKTTHKEELAQAKKYIYETEQLSKTKDIINNQKIIDLKKLRDDDLYNIVVNSSNSITKTSLVTSE